MYIKKILFNLAFVFMSQLSSAQYYQWAKQLGGGNFDIGMSLAVDASGNVYSTGTFQGTVDFDPGPAIVNLTSVGSNDIFISKFDASGNFVWVKQLGGSGDDGVKTIVLDASANVYTTGLFEGLVDFDPGVSTTNLTSAGGKDVFISKLDAFGNFVWVKQLGGSDNEQVASIALDPSNNVFTTGSFKGSVDFDPGASITNLTSAGSNDVFISKLDASGNFVWVKQFSGVGGAFASSIALDASGNVITIGFFGGTADFDPGPAIVNLTPVNNPDVFISKLDASGNFIWVKQLEGYSMTESGRTIAVDASGSVYLTGTFSLIVDFDPGPAVFNLDSGGDSDMFISKLDSSGNYVWAKQFTDLGGFDYLLSIVLDLSGNIYTTGAFDGTTDFDPGADTTNLTATGDNDIFISKLDSSGNFVWAKHFWGVGNTVATSIGLDVSGNIYTTGYFAGSVDFNLGASNGIFNSAGSSDAFIAKLGLAPLQEENLNFFSKSKLSSINVYPNPNSGQFSLLSNNSFLNTTIIVRDILGQEMYRNNYKEIDRITLNLDGPVGMYFVEVINENRREVLKVIKE